jgi:transposase
MNEKLLYFVGIDWACKAHSICVLNEGGKVCGQWQIDHSGAGLAKLVDRLNSTCGVSASVVGIAIEVSWGAVVETLIEHGFQVFSINPRQADRFRDRYTVAGAKDDSRDALVLASALRTDQQSLKRIQLDDPKVIRMRELSRLDEELKNDFRRAANQLWEQLHRYYPQMLQLSPGADDPFLWDLLAIAPMPAQVHKLTACRIRSILTKHRVRKHKTEEIMCLLKQTPLKLAAGAAEAASEHVQLLLPRLLLLNNQQRDVLRRIKLLLESISIDAEPETVKDASLLLSFPGVGPVIAATILAEAAQPIRDRDYAALRGYAGTAPVTRQSGNRRFVVMRHACSARLRNALYHWSSQSINRDTWSRGHYRALRDAGHGHARALRGLADRLLAILIAVLKSGKPYDPALRGTRSCQAQTATVSVN